MPEAEAARYRFNPFDLTKVWLYEDYPLIEVGKLVLDRNPDNFFADVEQAAFDPGHFVPGIGPSPDKMLQGRLFAYGDAHRYRLGVNHTQLPVNAPRGVAGGAANYGRDGAMRFDGNGGARSELRAQLVRRPAPDRRAALRGAREPGQLGQLCAGPPRRGRRLRAGGHALPRDEARTSASGWSRTSPAASRR